MSERREERRASPGLEALEVKSLLSTMAASSVTVYPPGQSTVIHYGANPNATNAIEMKELTSQDDGKSFKVTYTISDEKLKDPDVVLYWSKGPNWSDRLSEAGWKTGAVDEPNGDHSATIGSLTTPPPGAKYMLAIFAPPGSGKDFNPNSVSELVERQNTTLVDIYMVAANDNNSDHASINHFNKWSYNFLSSQMSQNTATRSLPAIVGKYTK